jgi:3'-5' exoribonuclease
MGGNFLHALEVAELCATLAEPPRRIAIDVLLLAALLHDAGKADEYDYDRRRQVFVMSERGALVGHRHTVIEWIAAAMATRRIAIPEIKHLGLLHCLTAGVGAEFLGIRRPATLEAKILSHADRLSGDADLFRQTAPKQAGFGRYHKHLHGRPYVMEEVRAD